MVNKNSEEKLIVEPEIIEILKMGQKIKAIKKLRELRNIGLKESKDIIDNYLDGISDEALSEEKVEVRSGMKKAGETKKIIFMAVGIFIIFMIYKQLTQ